MPVPGWSGKSERRTQASSWSFYSGTRPEKQRPHVHKVCTERYIPISWSIGSRIRAWPSRSRTPCTAGFSRYLAELLSWARACADLLLQQVDVTVWMVARLKCRAPAAPIRPIPREARATVQFIHSGRTPQKTRQYDLDSRRALLTDLQPRFLNDLKCLSSVLCK